MDTSRTGHTHGGTRPGAGRKPKAHKYADERSIAAELIRQQVPNLIGKMLELANGVQVTYLDNDGVQQSYRKPPDRKAIEYLLNQIFGSAGLDPTAEPEEHPMAGKVIILPHNNRDTKELFDLYVAPIIFGDTTSDTMAEDLATERSDEVEQAQAEDVQFEGMAASMGENFTPESLFPSISSEYEQQPATLDRDIPICSTKRVSIQHEYP